jgi:hypothetical protein
MEHHVCVDCLFLSFDLPLVMYQELNAIEVKFTNEDTKWCQLKAAPVSAVSFLVCVCVGCVLYP